MFGQWIDVGRPTNLVGDINNQNVIILYGSEAARRNTYRRNIYGCDR